MLLKDSYFINSIYCKNLMHLKKNLILTWNGPCLCEWNSNTWDERERRVLRKLPTVQLCWQSLAIIPDQQDQWRPILSISMLEQVVSRVEFQYFLKREIKLGFKFTWWYMYNNNFLKVVPCRKCFLSKQYGGLLSKFFVFQSFLCPTCRA